MKEMTVKIHYPECGTVSPGLLAGQVSVKQDVPVFRRGVAHMDLYWGMFASEESQREENVEVR